MATDGDDGKRPGGGKGLPWLPASESVQIHSRARRQKTAQDLARLACIAKKHAIATTNNADLVWPPMRPSTPRRARLPHHLVLPAVPLAAARTRRRRWRLELALAGLRFRFRFPPRAPTVLYRCRRTRVCRRNRMHACMLPFRVNSTLTGYVRCHRRIVVAIDCRSLPDRCIDGLYIYIYIDRFKAGHRHKSVSDRFQPVNTSRAQC